MKVRVEFYKTNGSTPYREPECIVQVLITDKSSTYSSVGSKEKPDEHSFFAHQKEVLLVSQTIDFTLAPKSGLFSL